MRAALYRRPGPAADVLRVEEIERPEPGAAEVRVRIVASGINPTDWKTRAGLTDRLPDQFQVPHQDGAGVVDAIGPGVTDLRPGDRVWVYLAAFGNRFGTAAEYTLVPAARAVRLPDTASFELGASLGVPALTAAHCLGARDDLAGRTVLVAGGAGAVGHFAIELAKHAGARVVSTVSGDEKAALAAAAGADLVVRYADPDAAEQINRAMGPVDRIVEVALGANLDLDLGVLRPGGSIVVYASEGDVSLPVRRLMAANVAIEFMLLYGLSAEQLGTAVRWTSSALAAGALSSLPILSYPLDEIAEAHDRVSAGATGKVLLRLPDEAP